MEDLKENLNKVVSLCENTYSTEEIISILKNGTVMEKQVAVLSLNELHSKEDVKILMENLTGIDGKVRQAVAFKILQLIPTYKNLFLEESFYEIFANSIIDIDSNVCRLDLEAILYLKDNKNFSMYIANKMKDIIFTALDELSKISFRAKKYTSNKQYFKIYWCLETLSYFYNSLDFTDLKKILVECSTLPEYTIREKCAFILKNDFDDSDLNKIKEILSNDENYYVRNV